MKTRAEMEAEYGSVPPVSTVWTIHRQWGSVTWVTHDGGQTWTKRSGTSRPVFARERDLASGYDTDDPKHPDWHSVHADLYDSREGK